MSDTNDNGARIAQPKTKLVPAPRRSRGQPRTARARAAKRATRRARGARLSIEERCDLIAAEFFAGGGMVHQALKEAGIEVAWANDNCPKKRASYEGNFPGTPLDPRSIVNVPYRDLPYVRLLHFSIPCQDFSQSGRRAGIEGERGNLAFQVTRLVGEARREGGPVPIVVVENVEGMLTLRKGADFARLVVGLHSEGMAVGALVADAALFGPQMRRRLFLVAWPREQGLPAGLAAGRPNGTWHPTTLRNAVRALPSEVREDWHWLTMPEPPPPTVALADIVEADRPGMRWSTPRRLAVQAARMRPHDREALDEAIARGERVGVTLKKRRREGPGEPLRDVQQVTFDGRVRCLTKGEGYEAQQLIFPDPDAPHGFRTRDLTPRERARLMGLPEDYVLPRSVKAAMELTGDGVVVDVYRHLAEHLLIPLMRGRAVAPTPRRFPMRVNKEAGQSVANRPVKRRCKTIEVRVPVESRDRLKKLAAAEGMSLGGYFLACVDRQLSEDGEPPIVRDAPQPRRKPSRAPRGPRDPRRGCGAERGRPGTRTRRPGRGAEARARVADPRSPFRYPGGKAQAAPAILSALGRMETLVEPFGGGASVGVRALLTGAADRVVIAEKDDDVRAVWEVAASPDPREVCSLLRVLDDARPDPGWWRAFLQQADGRDDPHLRAARALLGSRFRWGGAATGGVRSEAHLREALRTGAMVRRLEAIRAERRRIVVREDALRTVTEFRDDPHAAFFVDPPYSAGDGPAARLYRHHKVDHVELFTSLARARGRVLASYNDCPEVRALAAAHGFLIRPLPIRDGHRRDRKELMLIRGRGGAQDGEGSILVTETRRGRHGRSHEGVCRASRHGEDLPRRA